MPFDPATSDLGELFCDPDMFDSADDWRGASGFRLVRASADKICVASHKAADGYLFKKYVDAGKRSDPDDQLANYQTRVEGARRLRALIEAQHLQHVVVPRKWIRELPSRFGRAQHVLIVERLDVRASEELYQRIDAAVLRDLCVALHAFRGLDSTAKNVPFTKDGKIAFVDTEHWSRHSNRAKRRGRPFLKYLGSHLSMESIKLAKKVWDQLEGGIDGFEDEEDTSSSS